MIDQTNSGRQVLISNTESNILENVETVKAIKGKTCQRCGSRQIEMLPSGNLYCRACIGLGRVSSDLLLARYPVVSNAAVPDNPLTWQGSLTKQQAKIADQLVDWVREHKNGLVHAVTGAGKTEMLFKVLAYCLSRGLKCAIATPRVDVVNELYPRLADAFANVSIGKYHGKEYIEYMNEQLIIQTTHQLLKFYHAFDLLIIDEVDSFPYVGSEILHFGAQNAIKPTGTTIYLTATPTSDLLAEMKAGKLEIIKLNRRFHGHPLPVPRQKLFLQPFLKKGRVNRRLLKEIKTVVAQKHPLLLFVPRIEEIGDYVNALRRLPELNGIKIDGVHAEDARRIEKVAKFRSGETKLLVTTTILERGVTFKHVWVIVVASDDKIYRTESLVQIAGRVGRANDDPDGLVLFCYRKYTQAIRHALKQIKEMNQ